MVKRLVCIFCFTLSIILSSALAQAGAIHDATARGDLAAVKRLLKANPRLIGLSDVHQGCFLLHTTPLHAAAERGQIQVVKYLLSRGASVNARDSWLYTPLHLAANKQVAALLVAKGADLAAASKDQGYTPIHTAALHGHRDVVAYLRSKGAGINDIHTAVLIGDIAVVQKKLKANPNMVNAPETDGTTPLHYAALSGNVKMIEFLLNSGAELDCKTSDGETPLYSAVESGHVEAARYLLEQGANVDTRLDMPGETMLHHCAWTSNTKMAAMLISYGAEVDAVDDLGFTPLHAAARYDHKWMTLLLISKGADVNAKSYDGRTPLHEAATGSGKAAIVIIGAGADVNAKDDNDFGPLTYAGSKQAVGLLMANGAKVNNIFEAALSGDSNRVLSIVREYPKLVNSTFSGRRSPLHCAAIGGSVKVAEILIARGANVSAFDVNGKTPYDLAIANGNKAVAGFLLKHKAELKPAKKP